MEARNGLGLGMETQIEVGREAKKAWSPPTARVLKVAAGTAAASDVSMSHNAGSGVDTTHIAS